MHRNGSETQAMGGSNKRNGVAGVQKRDISYQCVQGRMEIKV